jgi:hypothetical protein
MSKWFQVSYDIGLSGILNVEATSEEEARKIALQRFEAGYRDKWEHVTEHPKIYSIDEYEEV